MEEYYLICEDSLEGIFTGVYDAYLLKKPHEQIHLCLGEEENYRLFAVYAECKADEVKAAKVAKTVVERLGQETYLALCRAMASPQTDKADAVYKTIVTGLSMKNGKEVMGNLANPYIHRVFELARFTANEAHFHVEFVRFYNEFKFCFSKSTNIEKANCKTVFYTQKSVQRIILLLLLCLILPTDYRSKTL